MGRYLYANELGRYAADPHGGNAVFFKILVGNCCHIRDIN